MKFVPLWSEINSIISSVIGRATLIISLASIIAYIYFIPESLLDGVRVMSTGALLVVLSHFIFMAFVPSVQRHYPRYLDYEDKCLKLENEKSLDLYEEFGCVIGVEIDKAIWSKSGLSSSYLSEYSKVPEIDKYKENFTKGNGKNKFNRRTLSRSLSAIKYIHYDSSKSGVRLFVALLLLLGVALTYIPVFLRLVGFITQ